jgi:hypothetical protein
VRERFGERRDTSGTGVLLHVSTSRTEVLRHG